MNSEADTPRTSRVNALLRGAVALLGCGAISVVVFLFVEIGAFLLRDPETTAEAHAMAHSAVGVIIAGILSICFGLAGGVLLAIAYVDRRRLSAIALVVAGLFGLLLWTRSPDPVVTASFLSVTLGGYALYEDALNGDPLTFCAGATALLWLVDLPLTIAFMLGLSEVLVSVVSFTVIFWIRRLLTVGALGILAGAVGYRHAGLSIPREPVVLAVAILLTHLPGAVWAVLSAYHVADVHPLVWLQVIVGTIAAATVLTETLSSHVRSFSAS